MNIFGTTYTRKVFSLIMLRQADQLLLGFKKRGLGQGKWNGFGGKLENGENPIQAAVREMKEESGLDIKEENLQKIGYLEFTFENKNNLLEVHIFQASSYSGILQESEEMQPKWFHIEDIPYETMWPDDKIWYPLMFNEKKFKGHVHLQGENIILSHSIKEVETLD